MSEEIEMEVKQESLFWRILRKLKHFIILLYIMFGFFWDLPLKSMLMFAFKMF